MVTDEEFLKLVGYVENLVKDVTALKADSVLIYARTSVLSEIAEASLAEAQGISRDAAREVVQKTVRKEYEKLILMLGDTSPGFAAAIDLDPERPVD